MPFTLAHPAAAVPFTRWGFVLSALIVGSISPDIMYFLCLSTRCQFGHTLIGLFLFDIPAGIILLWLFHNVLKRPVISLLPATHQQCLMPLANDFHFIPLRRFFLIVMSLLLGALTHIIWDSLTHRSGWVVQQLPVFSVPIIETSLGTLKVYKVLQYGSTFLGATLLIYWYLKWLRQAPTQPINSLISDKTKWFILIIGGLSAALGAGSYGFFKVAPFSNFFSFYLFIGFTVIAGITILFVELIIYSVVYFLHSARE